MEIAVRKLGLTFTGIVTDAAKETESIPESLVKILHKMALVHHKRHQDGTTEDSCLHVLAERLKDLMPHGIYHTRGGLKRGR